MNIEEMKQAMKDEELKNLQECEQEITKILNQYNCELVPVVEIFGNKISTRVEIVLRKL